MSRGLTRRWGGGIPSSTQGTRVHINLLVFVATAVSIAGLGGFLAPPAAADSCAPPTAVAPDPLPDAIQSSPYDQQLEVSGGIASGYSFATSGTLPAGLTLSTSGLLSGTPTAKPGRYTVTVDVTPVGCASSASIGTFTLQFSLGPSAATVNEAATLPAGASAATATSTPGSPSLHGRIACSGYSGCNTTCATFACDGLGNPMTRWYESSTGDSRCSAAGNNPVKVYNSNTSAYIGVYIDNEVDSSPGVTTNRQALVNCEGNLGTQIILVGLYPAETNVELSTPQGQLTGDMLEWYPFCNHQVYYQNEYPPAWDHFSGIGYITQLDFVPPGCSSGATSTQASDEWNYAWGQVKYQWTTPYLDLIGQY